MYLSATCSTVLSVLNKCHTLSISLTDRSKEGAAGRTPPHFYPNMWLLQDPNRVLTHQVPTATGTDS